MKTPIIVSVIVVGALAAAGSAAARQEAAQKEHTMTGCLQKGPAADTFVVSNTEPKGPKMIGIVESKANLAPHVGHKIEITGVNVPAKEAESHKPMPPKADHYMRLSAVKMVSATCP
jgi:hypothetical protein